MKCKIVPSILEKNQDKFAEKLTLATALSDTVQIDIVDSSFSDETISPQPSWIEGKTRGAHIEMHLMVKAPTELIKPFAVAGADRFIVHAESVVDEDLRKICSDVKRMGLEVFLGIDLPTNIEKYLHLPLETFPIAGFTVLSVKAGKSGQSFHSLALEKIKQLRKAYPSSDIEIDGGMNDVNIPFAKGAGANLFGVNSYLFDSIDPEKTYKHLSSLI